MAHTEVDFTYQEAVRTLGVTPEKLDRLIDEGKISVINSSLQTLIPRESILRYLATVTSVGKEKKKAAAPAKEAPAPKAAAAVAEPAAASPRGEMTEAAPASDAAAAPEASVPAADAVPAPAAQGEAEAGAE